MLNESDRLRKAGTVTINGVHYAVGLMWEPADDPDHPMKEAQSMAKSEGVDADFICLRQSAPPQYGLGWKAVGHSQNSRPLSDAVNENVGPNYVGAFNLGDKWWFGMSKNNIILPYGDAFYETEDEAKEAMRRVLTEVDDNTLRFAPADWAIDNAKDTSLSTLLKTPSKLKLSPTDSVLARYKNFIAIIIIICAGGYMAFNSYMDKQQVKRDIALSMNRRIEEAKTNVDIWRKNPSVGEFLDVCKKEIELLPLNISGWDISDISCDGYQVKASFSKNGGFIYDIENKADGLFTINRNPTGDNVVMTRPVAPMKPRPTYTRWKDLMVGSDIAQQMIDLNTKLGTDISLSGISPRASEPRSMTDSNGNTVIVDPVYKRAQFSFSTDFPIEAWRGYLSSFPGLSIDLIKLNLGSAMTWDVSGSIYQK